jgi:outer membrane protein
MGSFFGLLMFLLPANALADATPISVRYEDLPRLLQERNEAVQGSQLLAQSSQARTGYFWRSFLPQTIFYAGGEQFKTGTYAPTAQPYGGLEVAVNLFRGGRDRQEERIRQSQASIEEASARVTYQKELSEVQTLYWDVLYTKELLEHLRQAMKLKDNGFQAANRRFRRGLVTRTDLLEFEIYGSQLKEGIESLEHENQLNSIRLKAVLGLSEDAILQISADRIVHDHDETLLRSDLQAEKNPEFLELRENQEIADLQRSRAARWWAPSLDIYGGYLLYTLRDRTFDSIQDRVDIVGGVRLQFNLFDGGQSLADARSWSLQANGLEKAASQRLRHLNGRIKTTQGEMIHLHELLHASEERIRQGLSYLKSTQEEYDRGVKNSPDLLSAIERYISYQAQYVERRRDYQKAKVSLQGLLAQVNEPK